MVPDPKARPARPPGWGFVVSGIVLMVMGVVAAVVTVAVFGPRIDVDGFTRDVVITGNAESAVPGRVGFRVIESLSSEGDTMTVGVAVSNASTAIECTVVNVQGDPVDLRRGSSTDTVVNPQVDTSWTVAVVAADLAPGDYSAVCDAAGEPSATRGAEFTPTRVVTTTEVFEFAGPAFAILGAIVVGGLLGLLGLILLVVGLVKRSKARRPPPQVQPPAPPPWPPA
ncbi:MAG: hypothetical protein GY812_15895 [Actinomycetia bacterium]|nr:hypothetical protein [Actinomycetes bacterium]